MKKVIILIMAIAFTASCSNDDTYNWKLTTESRMYRTDGIEDGKTYDWRIDKTSVQNNLTEKEIDDYLNLPTVDGCTVLYCTYVAEEFIIDGKTVQLIYEERCNKERL